MLPYTLFNAVILLVSELSSEVNLAVLSELELEATVLMFCSAGHMLGHSQFTLNLLSILSHRAMEKKSETFLSANL